MFKQTLPLFLIAESPMHVGSGSELGIVDLPIQREKHTAFPKIEASSLKGALREAFEDNFVVAEANDNDAKSNLIKINKIFGYDDADLAVFLEKEKRFKVKEILEKNFGEESQFSGCISISDARLLLFPVKSLYGVFAWITCPRVLKRFGEDIKYIGFEDKDFSFLERIKENTIAKGANIVKGNKVYLEEFVFENLGESEDLKNFGEWLSTNVFDQWPEYWKEKVKTDIVVLDDTTFRDFVNLSTEVVTRTKIDNITGTVAQGALFSEEYLPAETVVYSLVSFADEFSDKKDRLLVDEVKQFFLQIPQVIQIGGNATLGKGIVRTKILDKKNQ